MSASAGWYQDPSQTDRLRYWDGQQWTQHTHAPTPAAPSPDGATPTFSPEAETSPGQESFATPAEVQANPVYASAQRAPMPYGDGRTQYASPPAVTGTAPKRGLGTGAILGIVLGGMAVIAVVGVLAALVLRGGAGDSVAADSSQTPTATSSTDDVNTADPAASAGIPADFSVPEGLVEVRHAELEVAYGVPEHWYDITDLYRPVFGDGAQESAGELVTFLSAWSPTAADGMGSSDILLLHSQLPVAYGTELYSVGARKGFSSTAGATEWTEAVTYTNDVGASVTMSTGTPVDPSSYYSTDMYVVGGGTSIVLIECIVYDDTGSCDDLATAVATMWVG